MARGPRGILEDVREAVEAVVTRPDDFPNMCAKGEARRVIVDPSNPDHHAKVFTVYGILQRKLRYAGEERMPLPSLAESLVKLCFPGREEAKFTWFKG